MVFSKAIEDAVVVMGPMLSEDPDPAAVRVRNITEWGFEFQIDEWSYLDGAHGATVLSWMAGSAGTHTLADGSTVTFGTQDFLGTGGVVDLAASGFTAAPLVFGQVVGDDPSLPPITERIRDIEQDQFVFNIHAEEAIRDAGIDWEGGTLAYAAFDFADPGEAWHGTEAVDDGQTDVSLPGAGAALMESGAIFTDIQTMHGADTGTVAYDVQVVLEEDADLSLQLREETSADAEIAHSYEDVAIAILDVGIWEVPQGRNDTGRVPSWPRPAVFPARRTRSRQLAGIPPSRSSAQQR